jgi:hypothetical protein
LHLQWLFHLERLTQPLNHNAPRAAISQSTAGAIGSARDSMEARQLPQSNLSKLARQGAIRLLTTTAIKFAGRFRPLSNLKRTTIGEMSETHPDALPDFIRAWTITGTGSASRSSFAGIGCEIYVHHHRSRILWCENPIGWPLQIASFKRKTAGPNARRDQSGRT